MSYEGSNCFRQRIILSTLTGRRLIISKIRISSEEPGVTEAEVSLLKLIEKITNGSSIEINETGTEVTFTPGVLIGGQVEHDCGVDRGIGYFLEVLFPLAAFCKNALQVTLKGVTNDCMDPSVDSLKQTALPVLKQFLRVSDTKELSLNIISRGLKPRGGGSVSFTSPIRRSLKAIVWLNPGQIKRIRGISFAVRVSPQTTTRMIDTAKQILLNFIPDVFIHAEHLTGERSGLSPGFGLCLWAETNQGVFYVGEAVSNPRETVRKDTDKESLPEDVAQQATNRLFQEIHRGGCVDSTSQSLCLMFMALSGSDLSKILLGPLTPFTIQFLRHMKDVLEVTFKLDPVQTPGKTGSKKIQATCVGVGFTNLNKTVL